MRALPHLGIALLLAMSLAAQAQPAASSNGEHAVANDTERAQREERLNKAWQEMPLESKEHLLRLHHAMHEMPPEDRKFIHDRVERYLNMQPEERERLNQNRQKWEQMSADQRQQAREKFQQRRKEFEEQWRKEHPGQEPPPFPFRHNNKPATPAPETPAAPPAE